MQILRIEVVDAVSLVSGRNGINRSVCLFVGVSFTECVEIAEALLVGGRHDVCAFTVFVPGREHDKTVLPLFGCVRRDIVLLDPLLGSCIVAHGHQRVTDLIPRHVVEADGNGRNGVNAFCIGTGEHGFLVGFETIAVGAPVVGIAAVKAHGGESVGAAAAGKVDHAVKAELFDFFFEVVKHFLDLCIAADTVGKQVRAKDAEDRTVVYRDVTRVFEVVFNEVRNKAFLPVFHLIRAGCVGSFPDDGKLGHIGILGVHVAVVEVCCADVLRFSAPTAVEEYAESLEVNTVFQRILDFPVSRFRKTFVIVAENRFNVLVGRNAVPAAGRTGAVLPKRADVHADRVFVCALRDDRFGNIVVVIDQTEYLESVKYGVRVAAVGNSEIVH